MRETSITVMIIFTNVAFWKFLLNSYEAHRHQHLERNHILQTWVNIRAKSFIKTSVNMKSKSMKVPRKTNNTKIRACTSKNTVPKWTSFDLFYTLFLSKLGFKFNLMLIGMFLDDFHRNLLTFLPFD